MGRRVQIKVNRRGEVETEFIGFLGDECIEEADRIRSVLARYGLEIGLVDAIRKSPEQIALETADKETTKQRVRRE
ncbi:MAG: hypothetical protein AB1331_05880 [Bacillota bacterium]